MQIMVGDNRFENLANRMSDAKVKEAEDTQQQAIAQQMEEKAKKASSDGVVLEISKTSVDASHIQKKETEQVARVDEEKAAKEQSVQQKKAEEVNMAVGQRQALENIDI